MDRIMPLCFVIQLFVIIVFAQQARTGAFHPSASYCTSSSTPASQQQPKEKWQSTRDTHILLMSNPQLPLSKRRQNPSFATINKPYHGPSFQNTPTATNKEESYSSKSYNHKLNFLDTQIISNLLTIDDDEVADDKYSSRNENKLVNHEEDDGDDHDLALGYQRMSHLDHLYVSQAVQSQTLSSQRSKQKKSKIKNNHNDENNYDYDDDDGAEEDDDHNNHKGLPISTTAAITTTTTTTTQRRVSANVKETGNDALSIYLKNIANHDLLRHEEEIVLGKQIQILVHYEQQRILLETSLLRNPTFTEWAKAVNETSAMSLKKQIRRSQRAKAAMIEANLRNVVTIARQMYRRQQKKWLNNNHKESSGISFQDLCQQGMLGLIKACERFDPDKGVRFYTYANWYIQQEVQRSIDHDRTMIRLPPNAIAQINAIRIAEVQLMEKSHKNTHHHHSKKPTDDEIAKHLGFTLDKVQFLKRAAWEALSIHSQVTNGGKKKGGSAGSSVSAEEDGVTLEHILHDPQQETPVDLAAKQMLQEDVRRLIQTLSPREQAVIRLRYGLDDGQPQSLGAIAQQFAVSKERIRKIESNALLKLRQPYRHESVKSYVSDL